MDLPSLSGGCAESGCGAVPFCAEDALFHCCRGAWSPANLFAVLLIQKINACFCLFVGIRPREALPAAPTLGKIQLELALLSQAHKTSGFRFCFY